MNKEKLKQAGLKITKPRELVMAFLQKSQHPLAVAEIYKNLQDKLDQVTVYRVLEALEQVGLVFKEQLNSQAVYYLADKQHHHIVCRLCGRMQCLPCDHLFKKIKGFSQIKHQLILTGLCSKCA